MKIVYDGNKTLEIGQVLYSYTSIFDEDYCANKVIKINNITESDFEYEVEFEYDNGDIDSQTFHKKSLGICIFETVEEMFERRNDEVLGYLELVFKTDNNLKNKHPEWFKKADGELKANIKRYLDNL